MCGASAWAARGVWRARPRGSTDYTLSFFTVNPDRLAQRNDQCRIFSQFGPPMPMGMAHAVPPGRLLHAASMPSVQIGLH
eukprot:2762999-Prymnesium_polylepis.1